MTDTLFRTWMEQLSDDKGRRPEWPLLLSWMLESKFHDEQLIERPYTGAKILIDRTEHQREATVPEKRAVYGLWRRCQQESHGCLQISEMPVWLLGYEIPNQFNEKKRCADLLGLTAQGGLVVFEAKLGKNGNHPPISAILEGLDYLSCLKSAGTFARLTEEFQELKSKLPIPVGFETVTLNPVAKPLVIILADSTYFEFHDQSGRSGAWRDFVRCGQTMNSINVRFAISEPDIEGIFPRDISWLT